MLANKIALVTGSSKGIGAGIALELAKSGADICVNYCGSPTSAEDVVNQIRSVGRRAIAIQADVSQRDQVERMVDTCEQELGQIDILVTNAIASVRNTLLETKFEDLQRTLEIGVWCVSCLPNSRPPYGAKEGPRLDYPYLIPARPFSV